jgi:myosin heavy subunit
LLFADSCTSYLYTAQGGNGKIDGVDDCADFDDTNKAFELLGFTIDERKSIYRLIAGLLLLGNVAFDEAAHESSMINVCVNNSI